MNTRNERSSRPGAPLHRRNARLLSLALVQALAGVLLMGTAAASVPAGAVKVELRNVDGQWRLYRGGEPYVIKGAGLEFGDIAALAAHGGNSFRTWRTENGRNSGQEVLDRALKHGLTVAMGIEIARERHGFNYNDDAAVARQLAAVKAQVLKYKDHPALLMWIIGNELNLHANNPKVWDAVNDISKMIHEVDPNHPTMTALAGINKELVHQVKTRAPDLDLIGIQMYADIVNLPRYLRESQWDGPYIVTEWGATGHWEVGKTEWGVPIENDSTTKADFYRTRYATVIASDRKQCVGSYVFLWGQKQERTPTWYGMFLETGEATATVDVMYHIWNGAAPANRSPRLQGAWLDGKTAHQNIRLRPGQRYAARVAAIDDDGDKLSFLWEILEESTDLKTGGDRELKPQCVPNVIANPKKSEIVLHAPDKPGAYRLFTYVFDGKGKAAHANIPFHVDGAAVSRATGD
jgi:hypothetical protein